jgi:hypothetical protein
MAKNDLLSSAYKAILGRKMSEDLRQELNLDEGASYADGIASRVVLRAIGKNKSEDVDFKAITELRETTEGKTPDKIIAAGTNEELTNLARIMAGSPAEPDSHEEEITAPDSITEEAEANFHG